MMDWIVANIICKEFEKNFERGSSGGKPVKAMDVGFGLNANHEVEEGYRHLFIRILATSNYVTVMMKESWNVLRHGETEYEQGNTGWILASHHDSCWREDGVGKIIRLYGEAINTLSGPLFDDWYYVTELKPDEVDEAHALIRSRDKGDFSRHINSEQNRERLPLSGKKD